MRQINPRGHLSLHGIPQITYCSSAEFDLCPIWLGSGDIAPTIWPNFQNILVHIYNVCQQNLGALYIRDAQHCLRNLVVQLKLLKAIWESKD